MTESRLANYILFTIVISATFIYLGVAGRDGVRFAGVAFALACVILNWQHFRDPVRWRTPSLSEIISVLTLLLMIAALVSFVIAAERLGIDLSALLTDRALLVFMWLAMILLPVPRLLKRPERTNEDQGT